MPPSANDFGLCYAVIGRITPSVRLSVQARKNKRESHAVVRYVWSSEAWLSKLGYSFVVNVVGVL